MSLSLLLDENISQTVSAQVKRHRPALPIESVHAWRKGAFEGCPDKDLLQAAFTEGLTLVTYDQKTIPPLLAELYAEGESHARVIFVDEQTISGSDFGTLIRALILLWEWFSGEDWEDRIGFLEKPGR